jgi:SEC-C motif
MISLAAIGQSLMAERKTKVARGSKRIGRNALCPCGSGLKFKKCCLVKIKSSESRIMVSKDGHVWTEAPPELHEKATAIFREKERKEQERVKRFGHVRPQMSSLAFGQRIVSVRNRLYRSDKWMFFPDFLRDYVPEILGLERCKEEAAKPEAERHPIIIWRAQAAQHVNEQPAQPDGSRVVLPSGAFAAFNCFAYDLFTVDDNGGLDEELLQRLKVREHFQGARHELFAEATCYRAGFTVEHENEKDRKTRHTEFTVRHVATGQLLSVEAKSRHRDGVLGRPGEPKVRPDFNLGGLINDAVAKKPAHPLVIFVDTNLPFKWAERILGRQGRDGIAPRMRDLLDGVKKQHSDTDPYSMIVFSNHPHHYALHDPDPEQHLLSVVPQQQIVHPLALRNLHLAAERYGNIPMSFTTDEGEPSSPAAPPQWPKIRYDLQIVGTAVSVLRQGEASSQQFSTLDQDRPQAPSQLHEFLEDIGLSRGDAHMICTIIEKGSSVSGIFAMK